MMKPRPALQRGAELPSGDRGLFQKAWETLLEWEGGGGYWIEGAGHIKSWAADSKLNV